ncbi:hypothetical protein AHAS_Ahas09G0166900 [Arachis hypogaea]
MLYFLRDGSVRETDLIKIHLPLIRTSSAAITRSSNSPTSFGRGAPMLRGNSRYPLSCKSSLKSGLLSGDGVS